MYVVTHTHKKKPTKKQKIWACVTNQVLLTDWYKILHIKSLISEWEQNEINYN